MSVKLENGKLVPENLEIKDVKCEGIFDVVLKGTIVMIAAAVATFNPVEFIYRKDDKFMNSLDAFEKDGNKIINSRGELSHAELSLLKEYFPNSNNPEFDYFMAKHGDDYPCEFDDWQKNLQDSYNASIERVNDYIQSQKELKESSVIFEHSDAQQDKITIMYKVVTEKTAKGIFDEVELDNRIPFMAVTSAQQDGLNIPAFFKVYESDLADYNIGKYPNKKKTKRPNCLYITFWVGDENESSKEQPMNSFIHVVWDFTKGEIEPITHDVKFPQEKFLEIFSEKFSSARITQKNIIKGGYSCSIYGCSFDVSSFRLFLSHKLVTMFDVYDWVNLCFRLSERQERKLEKCTKLKVRCLETTQLYKLTFYLMQAETNLTKFFVEGEDGLITSKTLKKGQHYINIKVNTQSREEFLSIRQDVLDILALYTLHKKKYETFAKIFVDDLELCPDKSAPGERRIVKNSTRTVPKRGDSGQKGERLEELKTQAPSIFKDGGYSPSVQNPEQRPDIVDPSKVQTRGDPNCVVYGKELNLFDLYCVDEMGMEWKVMVYPIPGLEWSDKQKPLFFRSISLRYPYPALKLGGSLYGSPYVPYCIAKDTLKLQESITSHNIDSVSKYTRYINPKVIELEMKATTNYLISKSKTITQNAFSATSYGKKGSLCDDLNSLILRLIGIDTSKHDIDCISSHIPIDPKYKLFRFSDCVHVGSFLRSLLRSTICDTGKKVNKKMEEIISYISATFSEPIEADTIEPPQGCFKTFPEVILQECFDKSTDWIIQKATEKNFDSKYWINYFEELLNINICVFVVKNGESSLERPNGSKYYSRMMKYDRSKQPEGKSHRKTVLIYKLYPKDQKRCTYECIFFDDRKKGEHVSLVKKSFDDIGLPVHQLYSFMFGNITLSKQHQVKDVNTFPTANYRIFFESFGVEATSQILDSYGKCLGLCFEEFTIFFDCHIQPFNLPQEHLSLDGIVRANKKNVLNIFKTFKFREEKGCIIANCIKNLTIYIPLEGVRINDWYFLCVEDISQEEKIQKGTKTILFHLNVLKWLFVVYPKSVSHFFKEKAIVADCDDPLLYYNRVKISDTLPQYTTYEKRCEYAMEVCPTFIQGNKIHFYSEDYMITLKNYMLDFERKTKIKRAKGLIINNLDIQYTCSDDFKSQDNVHVFNSAEEYNLWKDHCLKSENTFTSRISFDIVNSRGTTFYSDGRRRFIIQFVSRMSIENAINCCLYYRKYSCNPGPNVPSMYEGTHPHNLYTVSAGKQLMLYTKSEDKDAVDVLFIEHKNVRLYFALLKF